MCTTFQLKTIADIARIESCLQDASASDSSSDEQRIGLVDNLRWRCDGCSKKNILLGRLEELSDMQTQL